jgi:hypothetical protein
MDHGVVRVFREGWRGFIYRLCVLLEVIVIDITVELYGNRSPLSCRVVSCFSGFFNAIDMMHDHDGTTVSSSFSKCSLLTRFLFFWNTLHVS